MTGLVQASEVMAAGSLLRGDPASEIATFSIGTWMLKPGAVFVDSMGQRSSGQAFHPEAFAKDPDDACSESSDSPFLDAAVLIRVVGTLRGLAQTAGGGSGSIQIGAGAGCGWWCADSCQ